MRSCRGTRQTKTFATVPAELARTTGSCWKSRTVPPQRAEGPGAPRASRGRLRQREEARRMRSASDGLGQDFADSEVFLDPSHRGACRHRSGPREVQTSVDPRSPSDSPTSSETDGGLGTGQPDAARSLRRTGRSSSGHPPRARSSSAVRSRAAWAKLGGATGPLGAPIVGRTEDGDVDSQVRTARSPGTPRR